MNRQKGMSAMRMQTIPLLCARTKYRVSFGKRRFRATFDWNHLIPGYKPAEADAVFVEADKALTLAQAILHTIYDKLISLGQHKAARRLIRKHVLIVSDELSSSRSRSRSRSCSRPQTPMFQPLIEAPVQTLAEVKDEVSWDELLEQSGKQAKKEPEQQKELVPLWKLPTGDAAPTWRVVNTTVSKQAKVLLSHLYLGLKLSGFCGNVVKIEGFQKSATHMFNQRRGECCCGKPAEKLQPPPRIAQRSADPARMELQAWERCIGPVFTPKKRELTVLGARSQNQYVDFMLSEFDELPGEAAAPEDSGTVVVPPYQPLGWIICAGAGSVRISCHLCGHHCDSECEEHLVAPGFAQCERGIAEHAVCDQCVDGLGHDFGISFAWLMQHPEQWSCPVCNETCPCKSCPTKRATQERALLLKGRAEHPKLIVQLPHSRPSTDEGVPAGVACGLCGFTVSHGSVLTKHMRQEHAAELSKSRKYIKKKPQCRHQMPKEDPTQTARRIRNETDQRSLRDLSVDELESLRGLYKELQPRLDLCGERRQDLVKGQWVKWALREFRLKEITYKNFKSFLKRHPPELQLALIPNSEPEESRDPNPESLSGRQQLSPSRDDVTELQPKAKRRKKRRAAELS